MFSTCVYCEAATSVKETCTEISPKPHLPSDEGIIPELFKEYDMLLQELDEVLPETAHHTWVFHGPCTGMNNREGWWAYFMPFCKQSISDSDPLD